MVTLSVATLSVHPTTGPRKRMFAKHMFGGMPRQPPVWMYVMLFLYMWFCDHSEWWGVWVVGQLAAPPLEHGLGLWCQIFYSHTCVYFSATGKRKNVAPPTVRSL